MAVLSRFLLRSGQKSFLTNGLLEKLLSNKNSCTFQKQAGNVRCMSEHRTMAITPSRWQWHKTKDWLHFYFFLGVIPITIIVFYANIFIGPATLEDIPEGYVPKHWEYYRSPITRFMARYLFPNPQEEYEKYLAFMRNGEGKRQCKILSQQVEEMIRRHSDYPAYSYHRALSATYIKEFRHIQESTF